MPPACFIALIKDKSTIGTRMGMGYGMISFSLLIGGPGAGAALGVAKLLNWTGIWSLGGATITASGIVFAGLRVYRARWKLYVKV